MSEPRRGPGRTALAVAWGVALLLGVIVAVLTRDVVLGVIAGAACLAVGTGALRLWTGDSPTRTRHP